MPIGASKVGALGGLVPGGSVTFNASGTWDVPPGVKIVSITGVGGAGNPGTCGTPGNPGNPGGGAGGGGGGAAYRLSNTCCPNPQATGGGGGSSPGGGNGGAGGNVNAPPFPIFINSGSAGNAGNNGTAGNPGSCGSPGNQGCASTALGQTFCGGAGGNAGTAGNAGNQGNGGSAGNGGAGRPASPATPICVTVAVGNGGNGGAAGVVANQKGTLCPYTCPRYGNPSPGGTTQWINYSITPNSPTNAGIRMQGVYNIPKSGGSQGGGGGAGDVNSGGNANFPGQYAFNRFRPVILPTPAIPAPIAPGPINHPGQPVCLTNMNFSLPNPAKCAIVTNSRITNQRGAGGNPGGGAGGYGAMIGRTSWLSCTPTPTTGFPYRNVDFALDPTPGQSATNTRAGGGGGGSGGQKGPCGGFFSNGGGGGGGGGRGNAGNNGGAGTAGGCGSAATPSTVNCVPVTPGTPTPIVVGSPGGQIVISWNPQ